MADEIGKSNEIVEEIGRRLIETFEQTPGGLLFFAELNEYSMSTAYFIDHGDYLQYHDNYCDVFGDLLTDLRSLLPPAKRWSEIEYHLVGRKIRVKFNYPEDIDLEELEFDRRRKIVASYFGSKPTRYPKWGNDGWNL